MRKIITFIMLMLVTTAMAQYKMSYAGKEFIKKQETLQLTAYWDSNGYSIGYGHHTKDIKKGMKISRAQAERYFAQDIKQVEAAANRVIKSLPYKHTFSQGFFDGLCSLIYNCGETGVKKSDFYKRLTACRVRNGSMNKNDLNFTVAAVKYCRVSCKGHVSRRYDEHVMML